ncbi:MAG: hypothetical protein WCH01_06865, partial [Methylococcaceae bacterium]
CTIHSYIVALPTTIHIEPELKASKQLAAENAKRVDDITTTSERQGRLIDHDQSGSMEQKKREGYF